MEIAPGLYSMSQVQGIYVHAFLVETEEELILVDTLNSTDAKEILAELERLGRTPADLTAIVLTHAHRAHLGGLAHLRTLTDAPVYIHEWEADIVAGERRQPCMTLRPYRPLRVWPGQIISRFVQHPPSKVDEYIADGDQIGPLQVVAAPGHTPGHVTFFWPERRALFAGDALVNYPSFDSGWPGYMLNLRQQERTLRDLAELEAEVLCVGHGDPVTTNGRVLMRDLVDRVNREGLP